MKLTIIETEKFLIKKNKELYKIDVNLSMRVWMLFLIKRDNGFFKISSLAKDLEVYRGTLRAWIKKYKKGGYEELLNRHYELIKRSRKREGWVVNKKLMYRIKELVYNSNIKFRSKIELYNYLIADIREFDLPNDELNKWTFYKCLSKIISNEEFKKLMNNK